MRRRAERVASAVLDDVAQGFRRAGHEVERTGRLSAAVRSARAPDLQLSVARIDRRVFGGTFALEISSEDALLPATRGLTVRGRGMVRWQGLALRTERDDRPGDELAERLARDRALDAALKRVHFDRIRIRPDGRVAIRHMGGAVVWLLIPPMVRPVPLVDEQVRATVAAFVAFAVAGAREQRD